MELTISDKQTRKIEFDKDYGVRDRFHWNFEVLNGGDLQVNIRLAEHLVLNMNLFKLSESLSDLSASIQTHLFPISFSASPLLGVVASGNEFHIRCFFFPTLKVPLCLIVRL